MAAWTDGYWWSRDGTRLHYRDYRQSLGPGGAAPSGRPPILCVHGLTRNARDFANVADWLADEWRLILIDLRGRGESGFAKDPMSYTPITYLQDIEALLAELGLARFVAFGTSLGGLLTMLLAGTGAERIAGALLNDIGPELEQAGLNRIRTYIGKGGNWPTWLHAARALAEVHGHAHPAFELAHWLAMAKRVGRLTSGGRIVLDYDMKIGEPFRLPGAGGGTDLWPAFVTLGGRPVTLLRGAASDLLSGATAAEMAARLPELEVVEVPATGHAPTLDEPESHAAIARLLARVDAAA